MPLQVVLLSLSIALLDQATKFIVVRSLSGIPTLPVLPGVFHLTLVHNSGVAFGLLRGHGALVAAGTVLIIAGVLWSVLNNGKKPHGVFVVVSLGLILGGAVGNLIDRLRVGGVIDFLDFRIWPVFNVADSCITIGAVLMTWSLLKTR